MAFHLKVIPCFTLLEWRANSSKAMINDNLPLGQISVQGLHILIPFSSTSILELGQARTQELESTTKLSVKKQCSTQKETNTLSNIGACILGV